MATAAEQISQIYVGYFNRAPDPAGLQYWITQLNNGMPLGEIADYFANEQETLDLYPYLREPDLNSVDSFINQIYGNLFNRPADAAGLAFWKEQLESGAVSEGEFIAAIANGATGEGRTVLDNKVAVGVYFADELSQNNVPWTPVALDAAYQALSGVTLDPASVLDAKGSIDTFVDTGSWPGGVFNLTVDTDVATANVFNAGLAYTPGGNDRVNTLQDEDVLTGTGDNPTLNATIGNANDNGASVITPTLNGIETINARFTGSGLSAVHTLDLQDATGVDAVNITGITDPNNNVSISNLTSVPSELSLANTNSPAGQVNFTFTRAAVSGDADETTLTVANVVVDHLVVEENRATPVEGVETINLVSTRSANEVGTLWAEDLETLNISGDQDLTLGDTDVVRGPNNRIEAQRFEAGLGNVAGSLETIDASELDGDLNIVLGDEVNAFKDGTSGVPVEFRYTGAKGDDTVVLTEGVDANTDVILDGGEGDNTLVTLNSLEEGAYAKFQNLEVLGQGAVAQHIEIDTSLVADLEAVTVRNEGQVFDVVDQRWESAANTLRTDLDNVNADVAKNITVEHGTSSNNGLADNQINVSTVAAATTVGLSIEDGVNVDPRFNVQLNTSTNVKNISLHDGDSESNTVQLGGLNAAGNPNVGNAAHLTGTIEVTGGKAGQFLNLDTALAGPADWAGAYGFNSTGDNGSWTTLAKDLWTTDNPAIAAAELAGRLPAGSQPDARDAAVSSVLFSTAAGSLLVASNINASELKSDLVARLGTSNTNAQLGDGNDTLIFADRTGITQSTSGLTAADVINGGAGTDTIVLDGTGANLLGASEWTNLSGVDVIRLAGEAGATNFTIRVTDQLIDQTDAGDRITIINNDGALNEDTENVATIDLRAVQSPTNHVTFIGANGDGHAPLAAQTVLLNDQTAVSGNILNGGDTDVVTDYTSIGPNGQFASAAASNAAWAANVAAGVDGNNNVLQIFNTAQVTVADLSNTQNFSSIEFINDQASVQTLNLTLNNAIVDALVDSSHVATTQQVETLTVTAFDNALVPGATATLNLQAATVGAQFSLDVTGDGGNDTIVAGAGNDILNGGAGRDTIDGGAGNDRITGGADNDVLTGGAGLDVFVFNNQAETRGASYAGTNVTGGQMDHITDFTSADDTIHLGGGADAFGAGLTFDVNTVANATAVNIALNAGDDLDALFAAVEAASAGVASDAATAQIYQVNVTGTSGFSGYYAIVNDATAVLDVNDTIINLTGLSGNLQANNFDFA